ncbi:Vacuolar protein sorting 15 [Carabus blaptoides fortunei]
MGKTLVGIPPSQIFPVEHYLTVQEKMHLDPSLGSTWFLKVARAQSPEGLIVVKVFAIYDPTLSLSPFNDRSDTRPTGGGCQLFTLSTCGGYR